LTNSLDKLDKEADMEQTTRAHPRFAPERVQGRLSERLRTEFERERLKRLTAAIREHQASGTAGELARRPHDVALYRRAGEVAVNSDER
jgi:hypothetical protein